MLKPLAPYLNRFKKISLDDATLAAVCRGAVKECSGILLTPSEVEVREGVLHIQSTSSVREEVLGYRSEILRALRGKNVESSTVLDIR